MFSLISGVYFIPIKPKQTETNIHDQLKKSISNKIAKLPQNETEEQEISIPIIKKVLIIKDKQAWRRLQNNVATKIYIENKKEKEESVELEIENIELRNKTLKSQVTGLEKKINLIRRLMMKSKSLNHLPYLRHWVRRH